MIVKNLMEKAVRRSKGLYGINYIKIRKGSLKK